MIPTKTFTNQEHFELPKLGQSFGLVQHQQTENQLIPREKRDHRQLSKQKN